MFSPGKIIEYLDNGKFICGFITETQPKRLHLFNQNRREINLPVSRVIHCSQTSYSIHDDREHLVHVLQVTSDTRAKLMNEIDLEEIWDLLTDEGIDSFDPAFIAELVFGQEATDDFVSAFLRAVFTNKTYFKYKEGKIRVHSRAQVESLLKQAEKEEEKRKLILQGVEILKSIGSKDVTVSSDDLRDCLKIIHDYYLFGSESKYREIAKQMLFEAGYTRPHDAHAILVKAGVWDVHENIHLLRSNIPVNFSISAIQQAETILQSSTTSLFEDPYRKDFTSLSPITIDGATTLDFDDALTVEKIEDDYLVGIHISDVANYVQPGDPLFL